MTTKIHRAPPRRLSLSCCAACARAPPRPAARPSRRLHAASRRRRSSTTSSAAPSISSGTSPIRNTGLMPDRSPTPSFSSIAAVGFGLTAYGIGAERGYVTREQAAERTLRHAALPAGDAAGPARRAASSGYKGFFYHFLDMKTGERFETVELSTVDTALLLAGVALRAVVLRPRRRRPRRRSARSPTRSTRASTGRGRRRGRRRSAWAGRPRRASTPTTGAATTRR